MMLFFSGVNYRYYNFIFAALFSVFLVLFLVHIYGAFFAAMKLKIYWTGVYQLSKNQKYLHVLVKFLLAALWFHVYSHSI